ncbi:MAG: tRNA pseudouridine(55) synthase TruB [Clostridiaceae bacterium]
MLNGVISINKPEGISSFDVIRKLKPLVGKIKIGHAGTLDPLATGVLPICLGPATKAIDYFMNDTKVYRTVLKLGITTDTYDREGTILFQRDSSSVTIMDILPILNGFKGTINQYPPMYSAIKVNGQRLYDLARKGIEIEREAREVTIHAIDLLSYDNIASEIELRVTCSKGTYIRSLCKDIGDALGCGAYMKALTREKNGVFDLSHSVDLDTLNTSNISEHILPLESLLIKYKKIQLDSYFLKLFINGVSIQDRNLVNKLDNNYYLYRVYDTRNNFIGIGRFVNNSFKADKVFIAR